MLQLINYVQRHHSKKHFCTIRSKIDFIHSNAIYHLDNNTFVQTSSIIGAAII